MTPEDVPRRRASDVWSDHALDVQFKRYDELFLALNPLPTEVARMATRMDTLVTKNDLHDELDGITSRMDANRKTFHSLAVAILVALIGASGTVIAATLASQ